MARKTDFATVYMMAKNSSETKKLKAAQEVAAKKSDGQFAEISRQNEQIQSLLQKQEQDRDRQKQLRSWILQLRSAFNSARSPAGIVERFRLLADLSQKSNSICASEFEDLQFQREFLELQEEIKSVFMSTATDLGQANIDCLAKFVTDVPFVVEGVKKLVEIRQSAEKEVPEDEVVKKWHNAYEIINNKISGLNQVDEAADKIQLSEFPGFEYIEYAKKIPSRLALDRFFLKCVVLVVNADRQVERREQVFFDKLRRMFFVSANEATELFSATTQIKPKEFNGTEADAKMLVKTLVQMAFVDGSIHERERKITEKIAAAIKLPASETSRIFDFIMAEAGKVIVFDGQTAIQKLKDSGFKDIKNVSFGDRIDESFLASVGFDSQKTQDQLLGEFPVIGYQKKMLGITVGRILISDKNLYCQSGTDDSIPPVALANIRSMKLRSKEFTTQYIIRTGKGKTEIPPHFQEFLKPIEALLACKASG